MRGLVIRDTFRAVLRTEPPDGANMITARYVLSIKLDEDNEDTYKARYVVVGHLDITKNYLINGAQTIQCISCSHNSGCGEDQKVSRIRAVDVKIAYLQSDKLFIRKIFITYTAHEFELSAEECLELLKPIYSLADSGDEWHRTLDDNVQFDLKMNPTIIDPSL